MFDAYFAGKSDTLVFRKLSGRRMKEEKAKKGPQRMEVELKSFFVKKFFTKDVINANITVNQNQQEVYNYD